MTRLVEFHQVSKRYRLGLTRTSVPALVGRAARQLLRRRAPENGTHDLWAVRDVSLELSPGESLALIGPNGAGKSTVLKLLSNITLPTAGTIRVNGRLSALLELGAGFHPDLTGRDNIFLNGTILGLSRQEIRKKFDQIVAFSGLDAFIDTPVKRYSSGMQVRLGFAVAASLEPEILLVDEVLAVGDAAFRQNCLQRIRELLERGTSVVFVSHNLYMVQAICPRAMYLEEGRVKASGETAHVVGAYELDIHTDRAARFDERQHETDHGPSRRLDEPALDITRVTVEGTRDGDAIVSDQPARVRLEYTAYRDVEGINLAVFIRRDDGIACTMMRSKLDRFAVRLPRGRGQIALEITPLQLVTGSYFAEVEVIDADDTMVIKHEKARSDWFLVQGRTRSYDPAFAAVFEPFVRWTGPVPAETQP